MTPWANTSQPVDEEAMARGWAVRTLLGYGYSAEEVERLMRSFPAGPELTHESAQAFVEILGKVKEAK